MFTRRLKKEQQTDPKKRRRQKTFVLVCLLGVLAILISTLYFSRSNKDLDGRREHLSRLTLPPDGLKLYGFLLKEIPDLVSEIPCACCAYHLDACYKGKCGPT